MRNDAKMKEKERTRSVEPRSCAAWGRRRPEDGATGRGSTWRTAGCIVLLFSFLYSFAVAADWPMWRYDAGRTAASPEKLPEKLHLQWVRQLPPLKVAWPDTPEMWFDATYHPVVQGKRMIVASPRSDWVAAFDTETGAEAWRFYADGPVRFAPACARGKVYFTSDDGCLYCLDGAKGTLRWKVKGAPKVERKVLGNKRLISVWPARGAPVVVNDKVYFGAGIWPFMGSFVRAVDTETGRSTWCNSGMGAMWLEQPHDAFAFSGPAPQGYFAVNGNKLLLPSRTEPAILDRRTGKLLIANMEGKCGYGVATLGEYYFSLTGRTSPVRLSDGKAFRGPRPTVLTAQAVYGSGTAYDLNKARIVKQYWNFKMPELWKLPKEGGRGSYTRFWLKAGQRLYGYQYVRSKKSTRSDVVALDLAKGTNPPPVSPVAQSRKVVDMLAGDGKLFVVNDQFEIRCYGATKTDTPRDYKPAVGELAGSPKWSPVAEKLLKATGADSGYALVLGVGSGGLMDEIVRRTQMHVIAIDPDAKKIAAVRKKYSAVGLYGTRVAAFPGNLSSMRLPPYMARLIVTETLEGSGIKKAPVFAEEIARILRPYNGVACLPGAGPKLIAIAERQGLKKIQPLAVHGYMLLKRPGPLPGAGSWTHQYGDVANTLVSKDTRVKAPLGLLWFGGSSHRNVLPKHGHGPNPQVAGGRGIIEGPNLLRAVDVYTGQVLWEMSLPRIGTGYTSTKHQPGSMAIGANYVSLPDAIYVKQGTKCLRLDPETGKTVKEFTLPKTPGSTVSPTWGYLGVCGQVLLAGADLQDLTDPGFWPADFAPEKFPKARTAALADWVGTVKGFQKIPKEDDKKMAEELVRAFNRMLRMRNLAEQLPGEPSKNVAALAKQIAKHVQDNPKLAPDDMKLRELNRTMLSAANKLIPKWRRLALGARGARVGVSNKHLVAMDRHTGKIFWKVTARQGFRHNAIAVGGGKVFCIDSFPLYLNSIMRFSGSSTVPARLLALNLKDGSVAWSTQKNVFGTWLGYSEKHDALLQACFGIQLQTREASDRMSVLRGSNGTVVWDRLKKKTDPGYLEFYMGPVILHGTRILTRGGALDLLAGKVHMRAHALTGQKTPWGFTRSYGCNFAIASRHLLTFRSGAAGFYDLLRDGGTGNFGGFKSACSSNLIIADGVLCALDYTRECGCAYKNQTSVGFVHDPEAEMWTYNYYGRGGMIHGGRGAPKFPSGGGKQPVLHVPTPTDVPVQRVGLNFGAPGDRRAENGTLWLDWPSVGFLSPDPDVTATSSKGVVAKTVIVKGAKKVIAMPTFRLHSTQIDGKQLKWVAASGLKDVVNLTVPLGKGPGRSYTVRLVFTEPEDFGPGKRVFSVKMQGKNVLANFDISKEAGGSRRALVKEFKGIGVSENLRLDFVSSAGGQGTVLSGLEATLEGNEFKN